MKNMIATLIFSLCLSPGPRSGCWVGWWAGAIDTGERKTYSLSYPSLPLHQPRLTNSGSSKPNITSCEKHLLLRIGRESDAIPARREPLVHVISWQKQSFPCFSHLPIWSLRDLVAGQYSTNATNHDDPILITPIAEARSAILAEESLSFLKERGERKWPTPSGLRVAL